MKKRIIIILSVLVLVIGLGILCYKIKTAKLAIEKILPENAAIYMRVSSIEERFEDFRTTKLWHNIEDIDVEMLMEKSGFPPGMIEQYRTFTSEFIDFFSNLVLDKYFGQEIALAVYSPNIKDIKELDPEEALPDFLSKIILVTRTKPEAELIELISKIYNKFDQQVDIKYETYKDYKITLIALNENLNIGYVKIKDLLVIGLGTEATHLCIDAFSRDRASLSQDKDFISTMAKLPASADTVGYGNLRLLLSDIKEVVSSAGIPLAPAEDLDQLSGFNAMAFASVPGKVSKDKFILTFDRDKLNQVVAKTYSIKPQENKSIGFVPKDVISYQWFNSFNLEPALDELKKASLEPGIEGIEKVLGLSVEDDIIPALGNEVGGVLYDISLSGPFPIPQILLFAEVEDRGVFENMINTLTEKYSIFLQAEDYKDTHIRYILLPSGTSMQPAYCYLGNYLLIAVSREALKGSIDAYNDKSISLAEDEDFKALDFGLTKKNNAVDFVKTRLLLDRIQEVGEWGLGWYSTLFSAREIYRKQAEKELEDTKRTIQSKEQELRTLKSKIESLRKEIAYLQSLGLDASAKETELAGVEPQIKTKEKEIEDAQTSLETKTEALKGSRDPFEEKITPSLVKLILDEAIFPVLDGLKMFKATASRTVFGKDMIEMQSFTIVEE